MESSVEEPIRQDVGFEAHVVNQMQSFGSNPEFFNLTAGMEMLAFPSKNRDGNSDKWKGLLSKPGNYAGSSNIISKAINQPTSDFLQKPDFSIGFSETITTDDPNLILVPESSWVDSNRFLVDNSSLRCVFPCEGNERPSKGLSLSLCSDKPSDIGIQSFELRETTTHHGHHDIGIKSSSIPHQTQFQLKNSRYLAPAQELLREFCSVETKQVDRPKKKPHKFNQWEEENGTGGSSTALLHSLDLLQLQKRKTKLLSLLEEVDGRYRQYCDQMKAVVSSLEAVVGTGGATVYSASALKAMSKHFRCLRDGIVDQVKATKKAIEEKNDPVAPGTSRGTTPRLRLLDQALSQQKAYQQMRIMDSQSHPWRPQRGLPERSVSVLRAWLFEHFLHPYPSDVDKHILARQTGLSRSQVSNWFINARVRLWKPMVEDMYLEETKVNEAADDGRNNNNNNNISGLDNMQAEDYQNPLEDHKGTNEALVPRDSDSLSSVINNPDEFDIKDGNCSHYHDHEQQQQRQLRRDQPGMFGVIDHVDYSTYNTSNATSYTMDVPSVHSNFQSGVSLTLGLQQHSRSADLNISGSLSPPSQQYSLFIPRVHIEDCEYSMLGGEPPQNLPCRNLMGTQMLHDLAG